MFRTRKSIETKHSSGRQGLGWWGQFMQLYGYVKIIEFYMLNQWIVQYVNYISKKLLKYIFSEKR